MRTYTLTERDYKSIMQELASESDYGKDFAQYDDIELRYTIGGVMFFVAYTESSWVSYTSGDGYCTPIENHFRTRICVTDICAYDEDGEDIRLQETNYGKLNCEFEC